MSAAEKLEEEKVAAKYFGAKFGKQRTAYEPGMIFTGKFGSKYEAQGKYGLMTTFYINNEETGEVFGLNQAGDLSQILTDSGKKEGDQISIEVLGIRKTKSGFDFLNFNVV